MVSRIHHGDTLMTKNFFFNFLLQSDNELLVSEMQKNSGVTSFVSEIWKTTLIWKNWRT